MKIHLKPTLNGFCTMAKNPCSSCLQRAAQLACWSLTGPCQVCLGEGNCTSVVSVWSRLLVTRGPQLALLMRRPSGSHLWRESEAVSTGLPSRKPRDKIDPLVIVFSEIQWCQNPQFTQIVKKSRLSRSISLLVESTPLSPVGCCAAWTETIPNNYSRVLVFVPGCLGTYVWKKCFFLESSFSENSLASGNTLICKRRCLLCNDIV